MDQIVLFSNGSPWQVVITYNKTLSIVVRPMSKCNFVNDMVAPKKSACKNIFSTKEHSYRAND